MSEYVRVLRAVADLVDEYGLCAANISERLGTVEIEVFADNAERALDWFLVLDSRSVEKSFGGHADWLTCEGTVLGEGVKVVIYIRW